MGRFPDFTEDLQSQFLDHVRNGMRPGAAAEAIDLNRDQVLAYIQDNPFFAARVLSAEDEAIEHIEEAIYQSGASGNFPAAKLWLELTKEKREQAARARPLLLDESERSDSARDRVSGVPDDELNDFLNDLE